MLLFFQKIRKSMKSQDQKLEEYKQKVEENEQKVDEMAKITGQ